MPTPAQLARAMHQLIEPAHTIAYFADEVSGAWEALGLDPVAQGYTAGRAAPLGAVGPGPVAACFFNFNPAMIDLGLPAAWAIASPAQVLAARAEAMQACWARLLDEAEVSDDAVAEATALARRAMDGVFLGGRPLAAGNARVPASGLALADLWQALTTLREYRGDGHVAILTAAGLSPVEALVLYTGWQDVVSRRFLQATRLWDEDAWDGAVAGLRARGLADEDGLTTAGMAYRQDIEDRTDEAAGAPWEQLGEDDTRRLWQLLQPIAAAVAAGFKRPPAIPTEMGI